MANVSDKKFGDFRCDLYNKLYSNNLFDNKNLGFLYADNTLFNLFRYFNEIYIKIVKGV